MNNIPSDSSHSNPAVGGLPDTARGSTLDQVRPEPFITLPLEHVKILLNMAGASDNEYGSTDLEDEAVREIVKRVAEASRLPIPMTMRAAQSFWSGRDLGDESDT